MDYITKFYKNRAEDLYEKVIALENKLKMINEAMTGAYPSTYTVSSRTPTARKNYKGDAQQEFAARSAEAGGSYQVDSSGYLQSRYNPSSVKNSNPNARTPTTSSVPGGDEIARMSQLKPANPIPPATSDANTAIIRGLVAIFLSDFMFILFLSLECPVHSKCLSC